MAYVQIKPTINLLPPYKNGTNLIIATDELDIQNSQGIIVYGHIPTNILYTSVSSNGESKFIKHDDIAIIISRCLDVYYELKVIILNEYPDLNVIWLCPTVNLTKIIIKCVMSEKSETPTLYMRLYNTNIKSNPNFVPKSKVVSVYNESKLINSYTYIDSMMKTMSKMYKIIKKINVNILGMYGNDSLNFISETIILNDKEIVGISCLDHAKTKCAHTSTINIIDNEDNIVNSWTTGSASISVDVHKNGITTNFLRCDHKKPFNIIETIYYNPETKIAPLESQIHKMIVFILSPKNE